MPTYYFKPGTAYHAERLCDALVEAQGARRETTAPEPPGEPCDECFETTCQVVKADGEVCGRERPCQYHD